MPRALLTCLRWTLKALLALVLTVLLAWAVLAMGFLPVEPAWIGGSLAGLVLAAAIAILRWVRPWRRATAALFGLFVVVLLGWLAVPPTNDADWYPDVAVLPYATIEGDRVTVHNVRNCDYRTETDFDVRHYDREYDLGRLRTVDAYLCYWGPRNITHTIMSFGFESLDPARGHDYLAISIETRKKKGQQYSTIRGFFKQYAVTYVVADERDLVRLRTNFRGETVYLYRFRHGPEVIRSVLLSYLHEVNRLREKPRWYNALTHNCTTAIRGHTHAYAGRPKLDWRLIINGYIDEMAYDNSAIDTRLPFEELRRRSNITERARQCGVEEFSDGIRRDLVDPTKPLPAGGGEESR